MIYTVKRIEEDVDYGCEGDKVSIDANNKLEKSY